jgi:hypothetical protein
MLKRLPRRFLRSLLAMTKNVDVLSEHKLATLYTNARFNPILKSMGLPTPR